MSALTGGEAERFATRVEAALTSDPRCARRLGRAGISARFATSDGVVELRSGPDRLVVATKPSDAAVEVRFPAGALDRFATGHRSLSAALLDGEVTASGPLRSLLAASPVLCGLLRAQNGAASGGAAAGSPLVPTELPREMWAIEIRGVHKRFGERAVLEGVDLKIPEGAISVVLGPSGTGKSVLIKHIIGLLRPDRGDVVVHGRRLSKLSPHELLELRRRFGILFQDGALFGSFSVFDNVAFPLRQHTDLSEADIAAVVHARLEEVGLRAAAELAPSALSGGMRKRAGLARALVLEPEIVMFDEPDSGLDPVRTSLLSEVIGEAHRRHGGTYLVVTHDIALARKLGDYLALLWRGEVVEAGSRDAIFASRDPFVRQFLAGQSRGPLGME